MGFGLLGQKVARRLRVNGFKVLAWRRSAAAADGVQCFHGDDGWREAIGDADYVVCLLPLTPETENIIDQDFLATMKSGAYLINCARGAHVVDADLIAALDNGHLKGATLDVFRQEPLPQDHAFWEYEKIILTPHISSPSAAASCVEILSAQVKAIRDGQPLPHEVNRKVGY